jgi:hypothetical protein
LQISKKFCDEVDDSIIDFWPLVNQVIFGSFHMILPPTFSMKSPKARKTSVPEDTGKRRDADEDKCDKKRGKGNDNAHSLVKNEFPHGEICMLANETWVANFAGKQLDQHPQWNDKCKCCPRPSLGPPEVLFLRLPQRRESRASQKSPTHHPSKNVNLGQDLPQMTGWVGV